MPLDSFSQQSRVDVTEAEKVDVSAVASSGNVGDVGAADADGHRYGSAAWPVADFCQHPG